MIQWVLLLPTGVMIEMPSYEVCRQIEIASETPEVDFYCIPEINE